MTDALVIADVTGGNPNVMYELGLRHTTNKLTIQIGEKDKLPFDINVIRTIQFIRDELGLIKARDKLIETIRTSVAHGGLPVTATRLWLNLSDDPPAIPEIVVPTEEDEEPGFLEMLAEMEEAMPLLASVSEEVASLFNELNEIAIEAQNEMARSDARGAGAGGRLRVANQLARDLKEPADRIEQAAADFVGQLARIDPGITYLIDRIEQDPEAREEEGAEEFISSIRNVALAGGPALQQVSDLADIVTWLGGLSRQLRGVTRRMSTALRHISETSQTIDEWGRRIGSL